MQVTVGCVLTLLAAACCSTKVLAGPANIQGVFQSVPSNINCSAPNVTMATRGETECGLKSLDSSTSSFSFISGVCVLFNSSHCAAVSGDASMFVKLGNNASPPPQNDQFGYTDQVGGRTFWVFQQRQTGGVHFNRSWTEYEVGFGDVTEFWSGLQQINKFTRALHNKTLRIEATATNGNAFVGEWLNFTVSDASTNYTVNCSYMLSDSSNFSSDPMEYHRGMKFSTMDRDNDIRAGDCSALFGSGGFWYSSCFSLNPNAIYTTAELTNSASFAFMTGRVGSDKVYITLRAIRMMLQV